MVRAEVGATASLGHATTQHSTWVIANRDMLRAHALTLITRLPNNHACKLCLPCERCVLFILQMPAGNPHGKYTRHKPDFALRLTVVHKR